LSLSHCLLTSHVDRPRKSQLWAFSHSFDLFLLCRRVTKTLSFHWVVDLAPGSFSNVFVCVSVCMYCINVCMVLNQKKSRKENSFSSREWIFSFFTSFCHQFSFILSKYFFFLSSSSFLTRTEVAHRHYL
jgi:hypothetical protein